jgi:hypothetical protein
VKKLSYILIITACVSLFGSPAIRSQAEYLDGRISGFGGQGTITISSGEISPGASAAVGFFGRVNLGIGVANAPAGQSSVTEVFAEFLILKGQTSSPAMLGWGISASSASRQSVAIYMTAAKRCSFASRVFVQPSFTCGMTGLSDPERGWMLGVQCAFGIKARNEGAVLFVNPGIVAIWEPKPAYYYHDDWTRSRAALNIKLGLIIPFESSGRK